MIILHRIKKTYLFLNVPYLSKQLSHPVQRNSGVLVAGGEFTVRRPPLVIPDGLVDLHPDDEAVPGHGLDDKVSLAEGGPPVEGVLLVGEEGLRRVVLSASVHNGHRLRSLGV